MLGPLQFFLYRMLRDVLKFLSIFLLLYVAFSTGMAKICSHYVASKMELSKRNNRTSYRLRIYEGHIFELRIKTWMKVILAVMHTTWAVVKIRPEKKIQVLHRYRRGHGFKSRTRLNFFSGLISNTAQVVCITTRITFIHKNQLSTTFPSIRRVRM